MFISIIYYECDKVYAAFEKNTEKIEINNNNSVRIGKK